MHLRLLKTPSAFGFSLMLFLTRGPLRAASSTPIGKLRCDGTVYLNGSPARNGSSVYDGDQVKTEEGRATVSLSGGDVLVPGPYTEVALQSSSDDLVVSLLKGQVALAALARAAIRVEADGLEFSLPRTVRSTAEIALRQDDSLMMAVHQGRVSVGRLRPQEIVVSAGELLVVDPRRPRSGSESLAAPAESRVPTQEKPRTYRIEKRSRRDLIAPLLIGGIGLLAVIPHPLAEEELQASPSVP